MYFQKPLSLTELSQPSKLFAGTVGSKGLNVSAPGWGPVEYGGPVSNALRAGKMQIVGKSSSFFSNNNNVTAAMVIARYRTGEVK